MTDNRRANEAGYGYGREAEMQARYGPPVGGYTSGKTTKTVTPMTDDLPQLVQRQAELLGQCEAFIAEQFDADDGDAVALSNSIHAIRKTLEQSATALDTLTRALAEAITDASAAVAYMQESDAKLAAANAELDKVRPTPWAYEQACKALEKHKQRADTAESTITAAVREARAETWEAAAGFHAAMAVSSVIVSLRPLHEVYATEFRQRAAASRAADPTGCV